MIQEVPGLLFGGGGPLRSWGVVVEACGRWGVHWFFPGWRGWRWADVRRGWWWAAAVYEHGISCGLFTTFGWAAQVDLGAIHCIGGGSFRGGVGDDPRYRVDSYIVFIV